MEKTPIIGGTSEEKIEARKKLLDHAEEMKTSIWGTREKTPEQLQFIEMVNRYIREEAKYFDLEFSPITSEQVRFLDSTEWKLITMRSNQEKTEAEHKTFDRTISINIEEIEANAQNKAIDVRLKEFAVLLHEALHESGFIKYDIRRDGVNPYRVGYKIVNEAEKLQGFNEGVTELLTMRLLDLHKDEIKERFGIDLNTEEDNKDKNSVWNYINRRDAAVLAANVYEGDFDTLWRGYFTGNMMHLRKIEEKWGKGALRILSLLDDGDEGSGRDKIVKIHKFFDENTNPEEREFIKSELLTN